MSATSTRRVHVVRDARRRARWPRTSARSATSPPRSSPPTRRATVDVVARADGVIAGTACATEVFAQLDPSVAVRWLVDDGDAVGPAPRSARSSGPLRVGAHRRAHRAQLPVPPVGRRDARPAGSSRPPATAARIWDTRKTLPGLRALEKAAVRAGGGVNHRGSLSEFVLVKDNHLAGLGDHRRGRPGPRAVAGPHGRGRVRPRRRRSRRRSPPGATMVLLDNMTPDDGARLRVDWPAPPRPRASSSRCRAASPSTTCAPTPTRAPISSPPASITQSAPALDLALRSAARRAAHEEA